MVALSHRPSVVLPLVGKMVLHLILGKTFPDLYPSTFLGRRALRKAISACF